MRRKVLLALLLAAATSAGCTRFASRQSSEKQDAETGIPVAVAPAMLETMVERVVVTGTIRARRQADVGAQLSARVLEVKVREGDSVAQGQVLVALERGETESQARQARAGVEAAAARLEATRRHLEIMEQGARPEELAIARSTLAQADSALRTAAADLDRLKGLFQRGAVSQQQLDGAQMAHDTALTNRDSANQSLALLQKGPRPEEIEAARKEVEAAAAGLEQAKAARAEAEDRLGYTLLRSPLTGVVYERHVDAGNIVMPGVALLRVADLSSLYYEAAVPERAASSVQEGQPVEISLQGNADHTLVGRVERVVPVADPASRDFLVRIGLPEAGGLSRPGMFARAAIVVRERTNVIAVPKDALVERDGKRSVFVVVSGKAQQRPVEVGLTERTRAEIRRGLSPGESVVVVGAQGLKDGDPVQVREAGGA